MSSPESRGQMSDLASFDPSAMAGGGGSPYNRSPWGGGIPNRPVNIPLPQRDPLRTPPGGWGGWGGYDPAREREFPRMPPLGGGRGPMGSPIGRGDISGPRGYPMPPSDFPPPMPWGGGIPNRPVDIPPFRESPRLPPRGGRNPGPPRPLSDFRPMGPIERGDASKDDRMAGLFGDSRSVYQSARPRRESKIRKRARGQGRYGSDVGNITA